MGNMIISVCCGLRGALRCAAAGILLSGVGAAPAAAAELPDVAPPAFKPVRGVREYSGQLIVKPRAGVVASTPGALPRGALIAGVVSDTGEWIVRLPKGADDGKSAMSMTSSGRFVYAEPDWIVFPAGLPNDTLYSAQWHHERIGDPAAWNFWTGSGGITVAIVDSGVDLTHPDLASLLVSGYNAASKLEQSAGGDVSDISSVGHGTAVAGCAGAAGNNNYGVAGIGWNFRLMPIRASNDPTGSAVLSVVLQGARWAVDHGAKVINASYAGVASTSVQSTGAYIRDRGGILVWAAGNSGIVLGPSVDWPDVVIVGATDQNDARPPWANYGAALDVVAPGTAIKTTTKGSAFGDYEGTSFSSPIVAGALALAWSVDPTLTRAQVLDSVLLSTEDLGAIGEDDSFGRGMVDSFAGTLRAWREAHVLSAPFTDLAVAGPVDPIHWPVRPLQAVEQVHFGDDLNAPALQMISGEIMESTSIDLAGALPGRTQLRLWTFQELDFYEATIDVEFLANDGSWSMLVDNAAFLEGPHEHAWFLPDEAIHDRFAIRMTAVGSPGASVYTSTVTVGEGCVADFDHSGFVDVDDFITFVEAFEMGDQSADVDLSGFVDIDDFTSFVTSFGVGC